METPLRAEPGEDLPARRACTICAILVCDDERPSGSTHHADRALDRTARRVLPGGSRTYRAGVVPGGLRLFWDNASRFPHWEIAHA